MIELSSPGSCCGLGEIAKIGSDTPTEVLKECCDEWFGSADYDALPHYPFVIFTRVDDTKETLCMYIRKNKLGTVHRSRSRLNPSSENPLRVYLWEPNFTALKAWYKKFDKKKKV